MASKFLFLLINVLWMSKAAATGRLETIPLDKTPTVAPAPVMTADEISEENTGTAPHAPTFEGAVGYALTGIDHYKPSHQGWLSLTSIQNEFSVPAARIDFQDQFDRNEFKFSASERFKNAKRQTLKGELSYSPGALVYSRWSGELVGTSPVYGKPIEMVLGARYSSYSDASVFRIFPGFDYYFEAGWTLAARVLASQIVISGNSNSKWILGCSLQLARYFSDENYYAAYFSQNQDTVYEPFGANYILTPISVVGVTLLKRLNRVIGIQPALEWQQRGSGPFKNWYTATLGFVFKI